jgi:hypothetical protein
VVRAAALVPHQPLPAEPQVAFASTRSLAPLVVVAEWPVEFAAKWEAQLPLCAVQLAAAYPLVVVAPTPICPEQSPPAPAVHWELASAVLVALLALVEPDLPDVV